MTTRQRMRAAGAALAAWVLLGPLPAAAEEHWPAKPVTLLVGFAPGGGTDLIARQVAPRLSELLKQPVIVENRAGASGTIATAAAARARPDGYTLPVSYTHLTLPTKA